MYDAFLSFPRPLTQSKHSPAQLQSYQNIDHLNNRKQSYQPYKSNMSLRGMKQAITFPAFFLTRESVSSFELGAWSLELHLPPHSLLAESEQRGGWPPKPVTVTRDTRPVSLSLSLIDTWINIVVGFILVLLVTLSVPIIHSINMINAGQTVTGSTASLGVFGACYTQAQNL
jgi:hypothetical protein